MVTRSVGATTLEASGPLPGDALIPTPSGTLTHAITIRRPPPEVWPWIAQMGAGSRAGWYSYDLLDNGRQPSATRIVPELQSLTVGMVFPAVPGATDAFTLLDFEPERFVVLGVPSPAGPPLVTWTFMLREVRGGTRLVVRARGGPAYAFRGLAPWVSRRIIRVVHFVMQRKQLLGIAARAERALPVSSLPSRLAERKSQSGRIPQRSRLRALAAWSAAGIGLAAGTYAAYVALAWYRYGKVRQAASHEQDPLLDQFMPRYDVVERHAIKVDAPSAVTLAVARDMELLQSPVVRALIRGRELLLGATPDNRVRPRGLLAEVLSLGWVVLEELRDREIVVGAVTKPWEPNATFRSVPPSQFAAFAEPDYVKIAWTLRVDPIDEKTTLFRTETRVMATDAMARAKFRRYWSFLSPGIKLIRRVSLRPLKSEAERRCRLEPLREGPRTPARPHSGIGIRRPRLQT